MSGKRSKSSFCDNRACIGVKDNYGTIFDSMCKSKAYIKLNVGAKHFYTMCRVQSQSKLGKACLYKHAEEFGRTYNDHCFVFPASHLERYGIDRGNADKYFKQLQAAGFIKQKESNAHIKKPSVYEFVEDWKNTS